VLGRWTVLHRSVGRRGELTRGEAARVANMAGFAAGAKRGVPLLQERELGAGFLDRMHGRKLVVSMLAPSSTF
jgi:hypothetical protein